MTILVQNCALMCINCAKQVKQVVFFALVG